MCYFLTNSQKAGDVQFVIIILMNRMALNPLVGGAGSREYYKLEMSRYSSCFMASLSEPSLLC